MQNVFEYNHIGINTHFFNGRTGESTCMLFFPSKCFLKSINSFQKHIINYDEYDKLLSSSLC